MLTGPSAAKTLADQIEAAASKVSEELCEATYNARKTGVTSDDVSKAMMPFLDEVEELRKLPDSTAIVFDLVVTLGEYSYGDLGPIGSLYSDRPSDSEIDELLFELATERKKIDPLWKFDCVLGRLENMARNLREFGIEDFCVHSIDLLSDWQSDMPVN